VAEGITAQQAAVQVAISTVQWPLHPVIVWEWLLVLVEPEEHQQLLSVETGATRHSQTQPSETGLMHGVAAVALAPAALLLPD
jgi:hypothetical protein